MRYYLDTNILIFSLFSNDKMGNLSLEVLDILSDYGNLFYTSSVCVSELLHLYKSSDIAFKNSKHKNAQKIIDVIHEANIKIGYC